MQEYSRLVGIDVGKKRTGIAQTDLLKTIASPVGTYSPEEVFTHLNKITKESAVDKFIVGWPLMPDGSEGDAIDMVKKFIAELNKRFPDIPVIKIDERNTSTKAKQLMIDAGISKKKRREKERVDRIAAAVILQNYLDENF
ncbi:MAG: Holliday junction resolvase RuvX [Balneolaceae bacterium]|nr:Holliday junction resolvase RuvX [Balneolaceae bacterium]MBO6544866.1 Holliday junction resolvase RuvX [Balneolaceae bacterium]MBO6646262.1 Holliday junction resolvase RuvX [Balneolaceae bacterium]